jgi:hypothetical protein
MSHQQIPTQEVGDPHSRCVINLTVPPIQTTLLPSGKLRINLRLRSSYSAPVMPIVSSFGFNRCGCVKGWGWPYFAGLIGGVGEVEVA